jgi:hypothetical protein
MQITSLPDEKLLEIIKFVISEQSERAALKIYSVTARVNKQFNRICQDSAVLDILQQKIEKRMHLLLKKQRIKDTVLSRLKTAIISDNAPWVYFHLRNNPKNIYSFVGDIRILPRAACVNALSIVKLLLHRGVNPNIEEMDGTTALHWAAGRRYFELVKLLLAAGANPFACNDKKKTPYMLAQKYDCLNILELMDQAIMRNPKYQVSNII